MVTVGVGIEDKEHTAEITDELYVILRDGAFLRQKPIEHYLYHTVQKFGSLSEETIHKFIDEYWVL